MDNQNYEVVDVVPLNKEDQMRQRELLLEYDAARTEMLNIQTSQDWYEYLIHSVEGTQLSREDGVNLIAIMQKGLDESKERLLQVMSTLQGEIEQSGLDFNYVDSYIAAVKENNAQYLETLNAVSQDHIEEANENPAYEIGDNLVRDGEALFRIHVEKAVDTEKTLLDDLKHAYDEAEKIATDERFYEVSVKAEKELERQDSLRNEIYKLEEQRDQIQPKATEALKSETSRYISDIEKIKNEPNTAKGKFFEALTRVKDIFTGNKVNRNQQAIDQLNDRRASRTEQFEIYKQQLLNSITMAEQNCEKRISELQQQLQESIERSNAYQEILSGKEQKDVEHKEQPEKNPSISEKIMQAEQKNLEDMLAEAEEHVLKTGLAVSFIDKSNGNVYTISLAQEEKDIPFDEYQLGPGEYDDPDIQAQGAQMNIDGKSASLQYTISNTNSTNSQNVTKESTTKVVDRHYFKDALSYSKKVISFADRRLQQMEAHMAQSIGR